MDTQLFANNASALLATSISAVDTTVQLTSGYGVNFPSPGAGEFCLVTLEDSSGNIEIVKCTSRSTDVLTVTRAQEGTTAQAFTGGDARVELRLTKATMDRFVQQESGIASTGGYNVTGGTAPANGIFLNFTNTLGFSTDSTLRGVIGSTGKWQLQAPSTANETLELLGSASTDIILKLNSDAAQYPTLGFYVSGTRVGFLNGLNAGGMNVGVDGDHYLYFFTNALTRMSINGAGNFDLWQPDSGTALVVRGAASVAEAVNLVGDTGTTTGTYISFTDGAAGTRKWGVGVNIALGAGYFEIYDFTRNASCVRVSPSGNVVIAQPSSGVPLTVNPNDNQYAFEITGGSVDGGLYISASTALQVGSSTHRLELFAGGIVGLTVATDGSVALAYGGTSVTPSEGDSDTSIATTAFVDPARSHGASGYQKLSSGLIFQWGRVSVSSNNSAGVSFPTAFPTACYSVSLTAINPTTSNQFSCSVSDPNTTGFTAYNNGRDSGDFFWSAIGK